jgi:hypothetical protein
MHNKVVTMAARSLRELGAVTVRFNFRGTGAVRGPVRPWRRRTGRPARGRGLGAREQRPDGTAVAGRLQLRRLRVAARAAELQPDALISIAPPVGRGWDFAAIAPPTCRGW